MNKVLFCIFLFWTIQSLGQGKDTLVILQNYQSVPIYVTRVLRDSGKITLMIKNEDEHCYVIELVNLGLCGVVNAKSTDGAFLINYMPKQGGFRIRDCEGQFPFKEVPIAIEKGYATAGIWVMVITIDRKNPGIVEYLRPWTPKDGWVKYYKWDLK